MTKRALTLGLAALGLLGSAGLALAADLTPAPPPPPAVMVPPPQEFSWAGFFVGGNVGWGWNRTDVTFNFQDPGNVTFGPCLAADNCIGAASFHTNGLLAGGEVGVNFQGDDSRLVFGIVGDFDWSGMHGDQSVHIVPTTIGPNFDEAASSVYKWFSTVRGRVGFARDMTLFYVTGGVAFANITDAASWGFSGIPTRAPIIAPSFEGAATNWYVGWTAGGGIDRAISDRLIVGIEALYFNLGSKTVPMDPVTPYVPPSGTDMSATFHHAGVAARVHFDFLF